MLYSITVKWAAFFCFPGDSSCCCCMICSSNSTRYCFGIVNHYSPIHVQSNLDYPDSLAQDKIVWIIDNMNINEEQKLITTRKRHFIVKQNICKLFGKQYGLHLHCPLRILEHVSANVMIFSLLLRISFFFFL